MLVSLGQMLVITTGPGNADLSIPSAIALSSVVSMIVMDGRDAMIVAGLVAAIAAGAAVGRLQLHPHPAAAHPADHRHPGGVADDGRVWASAADGVHVHAPDGTLIGKVRLPKVAANLCFGGPRRNRLFVCATGSVYACHLTITG